jgi:ubiquitin-conjugating enzyme E2 variant
VRAHYELSGPQRWFSIGAIAAATVLVCLLAARIVVEGIWAWWAPAALLGGILAADFASGVVHWGADTWGRDDLPVIGHRLLVPFRVHHLNPDDFLRRSFIDTNGDVAFLAIPFLWSLLSIDAGTAAGTVFVLAGFGFCGVGMLTNQIHQWAHMPRPPAPVRVLQGCWLLLPRDAHAVHHDRPYDANYCITTGWCNAALTRLAFFRRLESLIERTTGAQARENDRMYEVRHG